MSTSAAAGVGGLKFSVILAGFLGGVLSLSFVRELSKSQMVIAVCTGTVTTHYLTPLALHYTGLTLDLESGVAFLIGIMAMNIIPGFIRLSELFKADPRQFIPGQKGQPTDDADNH